MIKALWGVFATFCFFYGLCYAWVEGGFFWILAQFFPLVGVIHGFGHLVGIFH